LSAARGRRIANNEVQKQEDSRLKESEVQCQGKNGATGFRPTPVWESRKDVQGGNIEGSTRRFGEGILLIASILSEGQKYGFQRNLKQTKKEPGGQFKAKAIEMFPKLGLS